MKNANPAAPGTLKTIKTIADLLESQFLPLLDAMDDIKTADLAPADAEMFTKLKKTLQRYSDAVGLEPPEAAPIEDIKPQVVSKPLTEPKSPPATPPKARRPRSKAYDFLLLEALVQRDRYGHPVGQDTLLQLATTLEPATKKGSLISKLNRWRNDKSWVYWADPENISLTAQGQTERDRLLTLVRREARLDDIKAVFKAQWGIDINLA